MTRGDVAEAKRQRRLGARWMAVGAALLLVLIAIATAWWLWRPAYRPSLHPGEVYGIDVSHHQGTIDWSRVAGDDIEFAYIKATEGMSSVDDRFQSNWDGAAAAGLPRGAYHFFTLCSPGSDQAAHFLRNVPADADALAPAVDLELAGNCSDRPDKAVVQREVDTFLAAVSAATHREVVVYEGEDFAKAYALTFGPTHPRWVRHLYTRPSGTWVLWQATYFSSIDGISGSVDLDVGPAP